MSSNTILNSQYYAPAFTGTNNIVIGPTDYQAVATGTTNLLRITGDSTGALIVADMGNRNIAFGMTGLTGPSYGTAQNVTFISTTSSGPSAAIPRGIGLFTNGALLQFINKAGAIGNVPPIQIFKTTISDQSTTIDVANNVIVALTGTSPWQSGSTGYTNTTLGTFSTGVYKFGSDANNSLWLFSGGLKFSTNGTAARSLGISVNGPPSTNNITLYTAQAQSDGRQYVTTSSIIPANSGDFIMITAFQNSGSTQTIIEGPSPPPTGAFSYTSPFMELVRIK